MSPVSKALGLVTRGLTRHTFQQELRTKNQKFLASIPIIKTPYTPATIRQYYQKPSKQDVEPKNDRTTEAPIAKMKEENEAPVCPFNFHDQQLLKLNELQQAKFDEFKAMTDNFSIDEVKAKYSELGKTGLFDTTDDNTEEAFRAKDWAQGGAKWSRKYLTQAQTAIKEEFAYALLKEMGANIKQRWKEFEESGRTLSNKDMSISANTMRRQCEQPHVHSSGGKFEHPEFETFRCHVCFARNEFPLSQVHQLIAESGYNCDHCGHEAVECPHCEKS